MPDTRDLEFRGDRWVCRWCNAIYSAIGNSDSAIPMHTCPKLPDAFRRDDIAALYRALRGDAISKPPSRGDRNG